MIDSAGRDRVFGVLTPEQDRNIPPGMIMQRAVVIRSKEVVQIDVEKTIAGNNPPAPHIGIAFLADQDIRRADSNAPKLSEQEIHDWRS
jgi:hypothetical protein